MRKKSTNTDYINTKTSSLNNTKKKILDIIDSTSTFDDRLKQKDEKLLDLEPTLHNDSDFNNIDKTESFINGNNSLNRLHTQEVDNFRASLLIVTEIKSNERINVKNHTHWRPWRNWIKLYDVRVQTRNHCCGLRTHVF